MQNKLSDLNNHLFAQLERLGDEDTKGDDLKEEIGRALAVTNVAEQIIANGQLQVKVCSLAHEAGVSYQIPTLLLGDGNGA